MSHTYALRPVRFILASIACTALLSTGGCSSTTSVDPVEGESDSHADETESEDGPAPNDDPSLGADTLDIEPDVGVAAEDVEEVEEEDVEENEEDTVAGEPVELPFDPQTAITQALSGNNCVKGGYYCGTDKVSGKRNTLYRCNGKNKAITFIKDCKLGCSINSGRDDSCKTAKVSRAKSPVPGRSVTYAYGVRNSRYAAGFHTGQDYASPVGTPVVAVRSGTIRWSNNNGGAYGRWMGLDVGNGRTYVYCHLSSRAFAAGKKVVAGQRIGRVGATGNVTGPHLHFEDHPRGPFVYARVRKPSW